MNRNEIKRIERAASRALPAPEAIDVDGWTVLLGRGEVHRLNSAVTNGYRPRALDAHIDAVERRFASRRRPPRFRLTELDATVDGVLETRGYERSVDVIVMTSATGPRSDLGDVTLRSAVTPGFVERFRAWGGYTDIRVDEIVESLSALDLPHTVATSERAVAVGVLDGDLLGLFDVVVAPEARRVGNGRAISRAIMDWGASNGASTAYLQVHSENASALSMYRSLGFADGYRYWYRSRSAMS